MPHNIHIITTKYWKKPQVWFTEYHTMLYFLLKKVEEKRLLSSPMNLVP